VTRDRIAIVIGSLQIGGAERQIAQIVPRLDRERWDIDLITLSRPGPLAEELEHAGFRIWSPPLTSAITRTGLAIRLFKALITGPWLLLWFLRQRPAIAHFILPEAYLIGGLCALMAGQKRMIMSRRSLAHYQSRHPLLFRIERFLHPRMSLIIANSEAIRRDLIREGAPASRLWVIRNGVDSDTLRPDTERGAAVRQSLNIAPDALVLMIVANLIPYKGHTDLLDALAGIRDQLPAGWQLLCIGRDDGIGESLRAQAAAQGLANHVQFLGSRFDIPELLNAADIGLLCSHEEGLPNAVLETMASGIPVIATEVGGTGEILEDGVTGMLVPARDPDALSRAILDLACDDAHRRDMGAQSRTEIERSFGLDICARAYDDLYRQIMSRPPQGKA
jgi:glycosyltransferase involved in cell wall biosynthesis